MINITLYSKRGNYEEKEIRSFITKRTRAVARDHRATTKSFEKYSILSENPIPFYKITGLGVRYKPSEILEWIERQKVIRNAKNRT